MKTQSVMGTACFKEDLVHPPCIEAEQIRNIYLDIGIPPHLLGYQYLVYAMQLIACDASYMQHLTTRLYVDIADYFETSPTSVGRAMKRAIATAWDFGNTSYFQYIFKNCVNPNKRVPTNALFLSRTYYYLLSTNPK